MALPICVPPRFAFPPTFPIQPPPPPMVCSTIAGASIPLVRTRSPLPLNVIEPALAAPEAELVMPRSALPVISAPNPPPPAMVWMTMAAEFLPSVMVLPVRLALMDPELRLPLTLEAPRLTLPRALPVTPPPPPTD